MLELRDFVVWNATAASTRPLSLAIKRADVMLLTGKNGVGKTTLLRAIVGDGANWRGSIQISTKRIAYHAQGPCPFPSLSLSELARLLRAPARLTLSRYVARLALEPIQDRALGLLSGGEAQRTKLALALTADPQLLLLDEPLSGIDQASRDEIVNCILSDRAGRATLWVEHECERTRSRDLAELPTTAMDATS